MGSVSGHVYRADTGAPIAGAILHLNRYRDRDQIEGNAPVPPPLAARTGPDGSLHFCSGGTRDYGVDLERQGFAPLTLNGPPANEPNRAVFPWRRGNTLATWITNCNPPERFPAACATRMACHFRDCWSPCSVPALIRSTGRPTPVAQHTDDRGDFRISGIVPGNCDVGAGPVAPLNSVGYRGVFYPNAATMENAQPIPVKADGETPGISLVVRYSPTYTVTVKVVKNESASGQHLYSIMLMSADPAARPFVNTFGFGATFPVTTNADGTAVLRGVTAGAYKIYVHPRRELTGARGPTVRRPVARETVAWTQAGRPWEAPQSRWSTGTFAFKYRSRAFRPRLF